MEKMIDDKYFFTADGTFGSACAGDFEKIDAQDNGEDDE
jgi:hypothetical protein